MLFSESWLRRYINPALSTEELAETLTMGGLEVEEVTTIAPAFTGVVVAEVKTCRDHENSDHLHVCEVDAGTGELLQIVCGAPNVAAGVRVPCALVGAVLPGDFKIKKGKLRGEASFGMLCSARELGVNDDHGGLWILPQDAPIGMNIREYAKLDDSRIEIKLTPNRGDALSVVGVARDLRAMTGAELHLPDMTPVASTCQCKLPVEIKAPELCGRFTGRVIRGLNAKAQTPQWMRDALERSGMRSISALVDISNYVMLEIGRPSHFYDMAKLESDHLEVRWAKEGEKLRLLNETEAQLDPYFGVIADGENAECLAGIMGGEKTSISDTTTDLFIEAAFWHQTAIQGRCRRLNFSTDASHRFERGVDFASNVEHIEYITRLVLDICATEATKVGPVDDQIVNVPTRLPVKMRASRCVKVIGMPISIDAMHETFKRLGFEYTYADETFEVIPPSYRFDIEIEEDLIEEVARLYGYEKLPDRPPLARIQMKNQPEGRRNAHALRLEMAQLGYQELINFSFVEKQWEKDFADNDHPIELLNPIASHLSVMRTQMVSGLVDILKYNLNRKVTRARLFEVGRVFIADETISTTEWSVKGVRQPSHIAGLAYGSVEEPQWGCADRMVDFFDVKGDVERLCAPLKPTFVSEAIPGMHPGRCAAIYLNGQKVGFMGELHPKLQKTYDLPRAPIVFEMDAEALLGIQVPFFEGVSKFQPVLRDLAVLVAPEVPVQRLFDAVNQAKKDMSSLAILNRFNLFDLYRPANDEKADKSLAFEIEFCAQGEVALSDEDIDKAMNLLLEVLEQEGARLRS